MDTCAEDEKYNGYTMFCQLMKLPSSVIKQRTEEMQKELALLQESTNNTIRGRKVLEEKNTKMTVELSKARYRRKAALNE